MVSVGVVRREVAGIEILGMEAEIFGELVGQDLQRLHHVASLEQPIAAVVVAAAAADVVVVAAAAAVVVVQTGVETVFERRVEGVDSRPEVREGRRRGGIVASRHLRR